MLITLLQKSNIQTKEFEEYLFINQRIKDSI